MAAMTKGKNLKNILLDIAREEKTHVGEFLTLLLKKDREQGVELKKGRNEIEELIEKKRGKSVEGLETRDGLLTSVRWGKK